MRLARILVPLRECIWDFRYEVRRLIRRPAFTFVAVASMSLAICAGSAFFSELNGTILRDVPGVARADELITLQQPISYPAYRRFRDHKNLFSSTSAYVAPVPFGVSFNGHTERIWGHIVTPIISRRWESQPRRDACSMHAMKSRRELRRS